MKCILSLVIGLMLSSSIVKAAYLRGLWVWNTSAVIASTAETHRIVNQCIKDGTTDIYVYASGLLTGISKIQMQNFVFKARCNNIDVWAMDGYRAYFADWDGRVEYIKFINSVIAYNVSSSKNLR